MTGLWKRFLLSVVIVLATISPAFAQQLELHASVDASEIELGDSITYTLQATSPTREPPSDPKLTPPAGMTIVNSGVSPSHMVSIINGQATEKHGLTAQWALRADRLGTFNVGPASVVFGGTRRNGQVLTVKVVPPGAGRPRRKPAGRSPFDPFGGGGGSPFDPFKGLFPGADDEPADPFGGLGADPKLALDTPRAPVAFLHATVDKTKAVVGEQVMLTVYLYEDLKARQTRPSDVHEATGTDFLKRSLLQDETRAMHIGNAIVGGGPWSVKLVRKNALFPLKTGRLAISPMSLTLPQSRVGLRESETLYVDVSEPPVAGRPAGYQIGDVGDFSLSAQVQPRTVEQHGAIGVVVELRGNGNMPATLPKPEVAGVEWLEPEVRDSLGPTSADKYGGTRTFSYVVRVHKEGAVDLGEIRLPFWDPRAKAYNVARAALGIVQTSKNAGRDAGAADVAEQMLPNLPKPRTALEGRKTDVFLTEQPVYWGALYGSPLACAAGIALTGVVRRARERRANAAPSPKRIARDRRSEAEAALKGDDGKAAVSAVSRAIEAELLASTGVNVRGTSGEATVRELVDAGVVESAARDALAVLKACEDARFSPSGVSIDTAKDLWKRARDVLSKTEIATSVPPPSTTTS